MFRLIASTTVQRALAAALLLLVCSAAAVPTSSAQVGPRHALYEPPDGFAYVGMFQRLWDSSGPLFMSPVCAEFNGNWWRSCSPGADVTLKPSDFVGAWRRVVDIFRAEGATNVAWVWNPIEAPAVQDYTPFYPGDDYVDWAGV